MALEAILEVKRQELARSRSELSTAALLAGLGQATRNFESALEQPRTGFILEHKRRSPSQGELRPGQDPLDVVRVYTPFADAVSVLTDGPFFGGSIDDLRRVASAVDLPVLRKDFIIDPYQVLEARRAGADAVLLMLSVLDDPTWNECAATAREFGMCALTEVHTEDELERAMKLGARVIGINSRDLKTLRVDLDVVTRLAPRVPTDRLVIAESGIGSHTDIRQRRHLVDGFLVGSSLMRAPDVAHATRALVFGAVKVCGLTRPEDARCAWEAGATWGGLVFADTSPRRIDLARAACVRRAAPLRWAGVFVDASVDEVALAARELGLDAVQLHGDESRDIVDAVRRAVPRSCEVWKSVVVREHSPGAGGDGATAAGIPRVASTGADRLLLDAFAPTARGGTGQRFDWSRLAGHPDLDRIIVAGGIRAENAGAAEALGVSILDVSSGVEEAPGIKSTTRLRALFTALRGQGRRR